MKAVYLFSIAIGLLLFCSSSPAQPYFYITNDPANGEYYVPGETVTALFTIYEDGELSKMRVTSKTGTNAISDLQPVLSVTDRYPPVKQYQLAVLIPANFSSADTEFVFEVTATLYGTHTADFKIKGLASIDDREHARTSALTLCPNPARSTVAIASPFLTQWSKIFIVTSDGKLAATFSTFDVVDGQRALDISSLSAGEYLIVLNDPSGSCSGKLIVR